ncbi:MAG: transcription-repair coupling factor [Coriobacteriia bacterium]|nr:transcription-repair coupling factor [Coriobacteriia bacterium]MCL2871313.1 transcription-repair coupling factor [Coriobacteriia bacterium]
MNDSRWQFRLSLQNAFSDMRAADCIGAVLSGGSDAQLSIPSFIRPAYIAAQFLANPVPTVIVCPTAVEAHKLSAALMSYVGSDKVLLLPDREDMPWSLRSPDLAVMAARAAAVGALRQREEVVIVTSVAVWMRRLPSVQSGWEQRLRFRAESEGLKSEGSKEAQGTEFNLEELSRQLANMGYRRQQKADEEGSFSLIGDVLAVYPPYPQRPFMVDFFDTEVESIRTWLVGSGQPVAALSEATLFSLHEPGTNDFNTDAASRVDSGKGKPGLVTLATYMSPKVRTILIEPKAIFDCAVRTDQSIRSAAHDAGFKKPVEDYFIPPAQLDFGPANRLSLSTLAGAKRPDAEIKARKPHSFSSDDQLIIAIRELLKKGIEVYLALPQPKHQDRIRDVLVFAGVTVGDRIHIVDVDLPAGFVSEQARLAVLTTAEIFPRSAGQASLSDDEAANEGSLTRLDPTKLTFEFNPGDYIVHETHGIALFKKVDQREVDGIVRDYLFLQYADGDMLYTPVEHIDKITKYVGADGSAPRVSRLGSKAWSRATAKAKNAAKQLAFDLADLYARRSNIRGFAYSEDTLEQAEMEAAFPFEVTVDQRTAIRDVKHDMQSHRPMDRLIIGDVGYGKTEVALRSAFKATRDGKQAMLLCPTTILAQQHYTTWAERLEPFGVRVEVLSRFRTSKQQREALEGFKEGTVHILIGTHRLLSADVAPKDLGLLVIDEEQRFGVEHKEQLKHIREQIDVLALSATPIPRTLQMSLSGVRDLSVIDTPPKGRTPVKVHVGAYDNDIVSGAIRRELHRGGQVYYISNRVKSIDDALERVREAAPEARIAVAHGQMSENELEYIMEQFSAGEVEVLIATTIVESGIDNPRTNTLIIEDAQRLGLSQLYQLKGRVGRSHSRAYACFLYPPGDALTPTAIERLSAIAEYDELGAGIKIAMRDLEIRGAGSVVGGAQSGQLSAVGFDLFAGMLSSALAELRGSEEVVHPDIRVDIPSPAYFAEEYMPDIGQRVLWYRRIAGTKDSDDLTVFFDALVKEYGAAPTEVQSLFSIARIRLLAAELGAKSVEVVKDKLKIAVKTLDPEITEELPKMGASFDRRLKVITVTLACGKNVAKETESFMRAILFGGE